MGLKSNDLEDLVSNLISIDEFDSKIDNEKSIVVGFKVDDKDPAQDLSRFIEKSHIELLDTEVSPAPGPDGYYVVFVEFSRDRKFPKHLLDLIDIMEDLNGIKRENYRFTAYKQKGEFELNRENLERRIRLAPEEADEEDTELNIGERLYHPINEAFRHYFGNNNIECILLELKSEEHDLKVREQLLTFSRGLNKYPTNIRKGTIFESPNSNTEIVDFNNLRLDKVALEIKKQLTEYNIQIRNSLKSFQDNISESLHNLFELYSDMFDYISESKKQLDLIPNSHDDMKVLSDFENTVKDNLAFSLKSGLEEYLNLKIKADFASLLNKLGLYNEVFPPVIEFLDDSLVDATVIEANQLMFLKGNNRLFFEVVDFGDTNSLFEKYKLDGLPFQMNEQARWYARDIHQVLGEGYALNMIKGYLLLSKANDSRSILLRD